MLRKLGAILAMAPLLFGCSGDAVDAKAVDAQAADRILTGGRIYTMNPAQPWAEAVAVRDGRIVAVGAVDAVQALQSERTEVVDLAGRFVMPGLIDGHAHPAWGGVIDLYFCRFSAAAPPDEVVRTIEGCVAQADEETVWIQGGLWTPRFFEQYAIANPREWLDRISGDKAVALKDDSGHNYWVNSRALELLGIDESSEPPPGGVFAREAGGERLNGLLLETFDMLSRALPAWDVQHYEAGARYAQAQANRFGVTGFKDASASVPELAAYQRIDQDSGLTVHVAACLFDQGVGGDIDVAALEALRDRYASTHLHTNFVKIFLDGVPTTARTAAMLTPYAPAHEGEAPVYGPLHLEPAALADAMVRLDAAGFVVKIHTAGDRSVHEGLNAIAAARAANGASNRRHELAHAGFIAEEDIPRFAELNAVADLSPYLWFPSAIIADVRTALGERGLHYWPNRDLLDSNAPVLAGSDWPSVAEDINPWVGMESLVTRAHPDAAHAGVAWPEQAITAPEALRIYTRDGAAALGMEAKTGSIEVGKSADLVVLDRNPMDVLPKEISETRVLLTLFEGNIVYQGEEGKQ